MCIGLVRNATLTELNLNGNRLRDSSMRYLASALVDQHKDSMIEALQVDARAYHNLRDWTPNQSLHTLRVSRNYLSDAAAASIARVFWGNTVLTTIDLSHNQIGEPGANALAAGLKQITEMTMAHRANLQVTLSRNRFGAEGVTVIKEAVRESGSVHTFKMEGTRPGFGILADVGGPVFIAEMPECAILDFSAVAGSRPATRNQPSKRGQYVNTPNLPSDNNARFSRLLSPHRNLPRTPKKLNSNAGSEDLQVASIGTARPRTVRILETPPPLYINNIVHPPGPQTDRAPNTGSDRLLPDIPSARPRTVRFRNDPDPPPISKRTHTARSSARGDSRKSSRGSSHDSEALPMPTSVRLKTAERATARASALSEHDPLYIAACQRLGLPIAFERPPRTSGARRKQQRIYEVRVLYVYHTRIRTYSYRYAYAQRRREFTRPLHCVTCAVLSVTHAPRCLSLLPPPWSSATSTTTTRNTLRSQRGCRS